MANFFEEYRMTSPYGWRPDPFGGPTKEFHPGVDLVKEHKGPIYSFTDGEVLYAGEGKKGTGLGGYGNVVVVKDKNGCAHVYAHLDSVLVKTGTKAERGQVIGRQGSTGRSTGSHLHYEIRKTHTPSYGWSDDKDSYCHVPSVYLAAFYKVDEQPQPVNKTAPKPKAPTGIKELGRIEIVGVRVAAFICDKPSQQSNNIATAELGSILPIAGSVPGWWEVIHEGKRAYVNAKYGKRV